MKILKSLIAGAVLATGLVGTAQADDPFKVGFIYVGHTGDMGWNYRHEVGRQAVEAAYGDKVETSFVESVPEGADAERVMKQMVLSGHDMIFTTSFGYMEQTLNVAKQFPNVKFEHATGYKLADNVANYSGRFYEGRAVTGLIAGHMTKTNKIGYIAAYPIPEVIRGINSAYIHAKKVNPDAEMVVTWVFTWGDPAKESAAAQAMIDQGVDVIMQHTDSTAAMAVAEKAGNVVAFGQAADMEQFAPSPRISSVIDDWNPYYVRRVGEAMNGTWKSEATWEGLKEGMVVVGEMTDVIPANVQAEANAMIADLKSGKLHTFTGPLNKQDGSPWLAAGETADDGALLGMNFYVEGISGNIPQ